MYYRHYSFSAEGMDPVILKEKYGDKLCFEGGVSVQTTLPFGTEEDVRNEVKSLIREYLGKMVEIFLVLPMQFRQQLPLKNIIAMFDTTISYYLFFQ